MDQNVKRVPLWKIKRELKRFFLTTTRSWPGSLLNFLFGRYYYDLILARRKVLTPGLISLTDTILIYLIYPNNGLLASHIHTLEYWCNNGYSPIVVSNLPLSSEERSQLIGMCNTLIERPNFGYDFGGYRDGVLHIEDELPKLKRLVLMNDSSWFPLPGAADWLEQLACLDVDFAAAASNYGIARPDPESYGDIKWTYTYTHRNFHYCSFAISISARILSTDGFKKFWRNYRLTNTKNRTVRRGEIGLSQWAISAGFTHGSTLDITHFDGELHSLSIERLRTVVRNLIIPEDPKLLSLKYQLLDGNSDSDRETLEKFALTVVARQGASYVLSNYSIFNMGFQFLKKSPVWLDQESSNITIETANGFKGEFGAEIRSEILALREKIAPHFASRKAIVHERKS